VATYSGAEEVIRSFFAWAYLLLLLSGFALWFASNFKKVAILSFPEMLKKLLHSRASRIALFAMWWWVGWHFLWARI
jgi:hypothetical protein